MTLFVLYKYYNYGTYAEKKEVMSVCTDRTVAHRLCEKYKWTKEEISANKVRVDGGPFRADQWKEDK